MRTLAKIRLRIRSLLFPGRVEAELHREMQFHLEEQVRENVAAGMDPDAARLSALRQFGGRAQVEEQCRDTRRVRFLEDLAGDLRYGLRTLGRQPGFTAVAIITLALGIGANTAIFGVINTLLLRHLPVERPGDLVIVGNPDAVHSSLSGTPQIQMFSMPLYREIHDHNVSFADMFASGDLTRARVSDPEGKWDDTVAGRIVTGSYFRTLGVRAAVGRVFTAAEDNAPGAAPVVVLGDGYWNRRFNRDPAVIGRTLRVNRCPLTIIGVLPRGFSGESAGDEFDIFVPMSMQAEVMRGRQWRNEPRVSWLQIMGRLKPGWTLDSAAANITAVAHEALRSFGSAVPADEMNLLKRRKVSVTSGATGFSASRVPLKQPMMALMAIVGLVLLVACVNLASLLLARASGRRREIAVRLALGAGPGRIVRQLLAESALLAFLGGGAGLVIAAWTSSTLIHSARKELASDVFGANIDLNIILFTAFVSLLTGLMFGLAPAMRMVKVEPTTGLAQDGRTGSSSGRWITGRFLVAAQVAICMVVLFAAGLLLHTMRNLQTLDPGYEREHLIVASVDPIASGYKPTAFAQLFGTLRPHVAPGAGRVTASENGLFSGTDSSTDVRVEGFVPKNDEDTGSSFDQIGPDYFSTVGIRLVAGREINDTDIQSGARVAVVNESFSRFFFSRGNAVGHRFFLGADNHKGESYEIIGVSTDVHDHASDMRGKVPRRFYVPFSAPADVLTGMVLLVRTEAPPASLVDVVRRGLKRADANLVVSFIDPLDVRLATATRTEAVAAGLAGVLAILVLAIAGIGVYGVLAYAVAGRTREIGIRMALGARPREVLWMVQRESLVTVLGGAAAGVPLAVGAASLIRNLLFGVGALDRATLLFCVGVMAAIALLAAMVPARRAATIDPVTAVRYE